MKKLLFIPVILLSIFLVGLIPFGEEDPNPELEIYLISNEIHFDIFLPVVNSSYDWREFINLEDYKVNTPKWIKFGWGDRDFYQQVPTWNEFEMKVALDALLLPGPALMHVKLLDHHPTEYESYRRVKVSRETYLKIVIAIKAWFVKENGKPVLLPGRGYGDNDNFYEAYGTFSMVNSCNTWVSKVLGEANLKRPLWSPTKYGLELIWN